MSKRNIPWCWPLIALWLLSACTSNNVALGPNVIENEAGGQNKIEIEVARAEVFTVQDDQRQALAVSERVVLATGQGVAVGENGRAILYLDEPVELESRAW